MYSIVSSYRIKAAINEWIVLAKNAAFHSYVDGEKPLLRGLQGSAFFGSPTLKRRSLVEFETAAPPNFAGPKTRSMYQVDALATRVLELLGARIHLKPSGGGNLFEYELDIKSLGRTTLGRILWGVPSGPRLVESDDHEYLLYVPATFDVRWGIDRNDVLLLAQDDGDGLDVLLNELFQIRDAWHAHELKTRRPWRKRWRPSP